jgi:adenine-specific DNA-methyltransferase
MHPNGWVYSEETMHRMVAEGRIIFRATEKDVVSYKRPLADTPGNVAQSVFERLRTHASRHLENVLGDKRFPYPKDHEVLMRWFSLVAGVDGVFLDFFAGSGSSAEAVIRLNVADGGARQCVLVTNNEVSAKDAAMLAKQGLRPGDESWEARGVFENVTKPRVETVVSGVRPDGSPFSEGLEANVEFLALTYQDGERVELDLAFEAIAPLLWLRAGATGPIVTDTRDAAGRRVPYEFGANYAVLFNPDRWRSFIDQMTDAIRTVFIVTDSATTFATVAAELPTDVEPVRLYRNYLSTFEINRGLRA